MVIIPVVREVSFQGFLFKATTFTLDELAERSLMSPLAGMKHTYVAWFTLVR